MKKLFTLLFAVGFATGLLAQVDRKVLLEEFTNASCPPCASQNPAFNALIDANEDVVVAIKYQTAFPGFDPFNQQNPGEVATRADYYGLSGVPTAWINGTAGDDSYAGGAGDWDVAGGGYEGGPYGYNQAVIDFAAMQTTPISMTIDHVLNDDATMATVTVTITNESDAAFGMEDGRLHVAMLEAEVVFPEPPGSTNELEFTDIMRKMYPNENGTMLTDSLPAGETATYTFDVDVPDYIYGLNEIRFIAFVQDHATTEVFQAENTAPMLIANGVDPAFGANLTAAPVGLCNASITPSIELTNNGAATITQASVSANINGTVIQTLEFTGALENGQTETLTFDMVMLTEANNTLTFSIDEVNNGDGLDVNLLNNEAAAVTYSSLSEDPIGTELMESNETYASASYPETAVVQPGIPAGEFGGNSFQVFNITDLSADITTPAGAYGESDRSILINFYQWNPATAPAGVGTMTYQKIDLTDAMNPILTFDRASASWSGDGTSGDALEIYVSTDCAESFEIVWAASGAELNTTAAQNPFYVPEPGHWVSDTVDLTDYIGENVNVQFRAISAWGNNLYLDNINIVEGEVISSVPELTEVSGLNVFPNPVQGELNVQFQLAETTRLDVGVFNALGQRVGTLTSGTFGAGAHTFRYSTSDLSNGVYHLRLTDGEALRTRKFTVLGQ